MADIVKHDRPRITSLERLVELAKHKKAVVFNGGKIKPAAVVLNMQGAVIAAMIRNGNLFEYIKPISEKKPLAFYRSGKAKRPLYAELEEQFKKSKEMIKNLIEAYETFADPDEVSALIRQAEELIQE